MTHSWSTRQELEHQSVTLARQGLSRRAIARALEVSRNTIKKILAAHGQARAEPHSSLSAPPSMAPRLQKLDAFADKVTDLMVRYPEITARRIFEELQGAGYDGGYTAVKDRVRKARPREAATPSLQTPESGPGELAESDWSPHVIAFTDGTRMTVQVFDYVLRWSRRKCIYLYERCDLHALMDAHVASFARLGGAADACKYDSQKPVVLHWEGQQPIYNPRFVAFATHYEFRPQACRRRAPNEKPRAERTFWEFERSFLNGRRFRDLADMRQQLAGWLDGICDTRPQRQTKRTPLEAFAEEKPHLLPLPAHPYDTARVLYRVCSIDGFVAYDGNRYAVPYDHVTDILPVRVTQNEVFIYAADLRVVARHELVPRGAGKDVRPQGMHQPWRKRATDGDQLRRAFAGLGDDAALFFEGLLAAEPRFFAHHARHILLLRERFDSDAIVAALRHARRFGAFDHKAIQRILAARALPRSLAEYVDQDTARRLAESLDPRDLPHRDLDEYDHLPVVSPAKERPACPDASTPPAPTRSSSGSDDTSSSSD